MKAGSNLKSQITVCHDSQTVGVGCRYIANLVLQLKYISFCLSWNENLIYHKDEGGGAVNILQLLSVCKQYTNTVRWVVKLTDGS